MTPVEKVMKILSVLGEPPYEYKVAKVSVHTGITNVIISGKLALAEGQIVNGRLGRTVRKQIV